MRSIDNLREYALTAASVNATTRAVLAGYVDEIEREVEELRDRDYRNGREDAKGAVEFADRLKSAVDKRADVTLFGVDYTALPVDADGVPIHFGDVLDQFGTPMTVFAMSDPDPNQGDCMLELITDGTSDGTWVRARKMRHHHAPTVEDVLAEMLDVWGELPSNVTNEAIIAEYAAKLRLAEGEDA